MRIDTYEGSRIYDARWAVDGFDGDGFQSHFDNALNGGFKAFSTLQRLGVHAPDALVEASSYALLGGKHADRMVLTVQAAADPQAGARDKVTSAFPWVETGTEVSAVLTRVQEWPSGPSAIVTAEIGEGSVLRFFDAMYARDRGFYHAAPDRWPMRFCIAGLAYAAAAAQEPRLSKGALPSLSALMATHDDECAEYHFGGPIQTIQPRLFFGAPAWLVTVKLHDIGHSPLDLPILIPVHAMQSQMPAVGEGIEGVLCLQGWLRGPDR